METIIFYTKLNCHLCEEAYQMLMEFTLEIPLEIDVVDVSHSHNSHLLEIYADRIPILAKPGDPRELEWPFTSADIQAFLES
jgi:hypothetical protein